MDNLTHAFVGAAMGEYALAARPSSRTRSVFAYVGIVAASAPDVDVLYAGITEEPLGYLLHHRGHSHTLPGLAILGMLIWSGVLLLPSARRAVRGVHLRVGLMIAAALVSHLLMDTANSYGTHLFYPYSSRWVYGDAVFVLEPWLWAILGVTLALSADRFWRVVVLLLTFVPIAGLAVVGLIQAGVMVVVFGATGAAAIVARAWDPKSRAGAALVATAAVFFMMSGVSRAAKSEARAAAAAMSGGELLDVVADANPGVPWCWTVLTVQKTTAGPAAALVARRGTLSLLPGVWPAASCASARLGLRWSTDAATSNVIVWHRQWRIDVQELRVRAADNCRVRAWLQFGRVPYLDKGRIVDLRYENPIAPNFTPMAVDEGARGCPAYLTEWEWPRRDVIGDPFDRP